MDKIKKYLLSANSAEGFIEYFDFINDLTKPNYTYILKGGPGTGKSTLMKKVGEHFSSKGFNVEFFYCSSDVESLDGVRIAEKNIAVVDGTAPHVREARIPKVTEEIVNLGEFISENVKANKKTIEQQLIKKQNSFKIANCLIISAGKLYDAVQLFENDKDCEIKIKNFIKSLNLTKVKNKKVFNRNLFANAVTENGISRIFDCKDLTEITLPQQRSEWVENLIKYINKCGINVIRFMNILKPHECEAVLIPEKFYIKFENKSENETVLKLKSKINEILVMAGEVLLEAKTEHKKIEQFYIDNMDFENLNILTENLIKDIEQKKLSR